MAAIDATAGDPEIDLPSAQEEMTATFARYEAALLANDRATLDELFWPDERTVRVGIDDRQDGFAAVSAFRSGQPRQTPPRRLRNTVIVTFGSTSAVVTTDFVPTDGSPPGRQSQTWVRFEAGWRVVAAHVSRSSSASVHGVDPEPQQRGHRAKTANPYSRLNVDGVAWSPGACAATAPTRS